MERRIGMLIGKGFTNEDYAEMLCAVNGYHWDDRFGPKPQGFDEMTNDQRELFTSPYFCELEALVSEYDFLRCWNVKHLRSMTAEEFDEYFTTGRRPASLATQQVVEPVPRSLTPLFIVGAIVVLLILGTAIILTALQ